MKTQLYPITIICITILVCSSCGITRQTTCPTFANKTEKVHKPLFSKKQSPKKDKKQFAKITDQRKKKKANNNKFAQIENIISKIEMSDIAASSDNDITLNPTDIAPSFDESKLQKLLYKKVEKKRKKVLATLEKHNQENCEQFVSKKKHKKKHKKRFNNKNDDSTDTREVHDFAIISLVAGIAIFITPIFALLISNWFLILSMLLAALAITWGIDGIYQVNKNPSKYKGKGMAITGIILGYLAFSILLAAFPLYLYFASIP